MHVMTKIWLYLITFYFARETVLYLYKRPTGFDGHPSTIALSDSGDLKMKRDQISLNMNYGIFHFCSEIAINYSFIINIDKLLIMKNANNDCSCLL